MLRLYKTRKKAIAAAIASLNAYGVPSMIQQQLSHLLEEHDGRELYRANPRLLATHLKLPEREMLKILVMGLKEGIVTLHWEVECPACHGLDARPKRLQQLRTLHTCPLCSHTHPTDIDAGVRVTFSIDERLRRLEPEADDPLFRQRMDRRYGAVSGHRVLTLPLFRRLFPRETVLPSESLLVRRVAILFTDLAGSTALYARRGDTQAYELVRKHFELLFQIVDDHNGAVIKTIGDAVMAAFTEPLDAMTAAIAMHHHLVKLNQQLTLPPTEHLRLKIGIDVGPCINVTLNDRLDYFGTTVNTAARIQATGRGNSVAVTDALMATISHTPLLHDCTIRQQALVLKGLKAPTTVYYVSPPPIDT